MPPYQETPYSKVQSRRRKGGERERKGESFIRDHDFGRGGFIHIPRTA